MPDREWTGIPRWLTLVGIVLAILLLLVGAVVLIGGGHEGPGRHAPGTSVTEDHQPPRGRHV